MDELCGVLSIRARLGGGWVGSLRRVFRGSTQNWKGLLTGGEGSATAGSKSKCEAMGINKMLQFINISI